MAVALWYSIAALLVLAFFYMRPMFEDFGLELPTWTRLLLHPMAFVMCCTIATAILVRALLTENRDQLAVTGRIALALGMIVMFGAIFGMFVPLYQLLKGLS